MSSQQWIRKEVLEAPAYKLESYPECVKLNQNESPYDIPADLKAEILQDIVTNPWNRYPLAEPVNLKKKLAKHLDIWPDEILITNGSNVLIQAVVAATSIKKKVMTIYPTFSLYALEAHLFGNKVLEVELEEDFSLPLAAAIDLIQKEKPSLVMLPNPNAPTANLFDEASLLEVVKKARVPVVIDEAYDPFSGQSFLSQRRNYENLILLRTFSKAFSLGGVRLGYMVADPEIVREIEKMTLPFCVNQISQLVAERVLEHPQYIDAIVRQICDERERVFMAMQKLDGVQVYPSRTNFLLFRVVHARAVFNRLLRQGVLVRDVSDDRRLSHCLRVSIGLPQENDAFLAALTKAIATINHVGEQTVEESSATGAMSLENTVENHPDNPTEPPTPES